MQLTAPLTIYDHDGQPVRGSALAALVLALTIVLGTSAAQTVMLFAAPDLAGVLTFAWLLLYLLAGGGLMLHHGINWLSWVTRYRILLLALLFGAALSVSWSVAPTLSAERVVHLSGACILAIYIGFMLPLLRLLRVSAVVLGGLLLLSAAAAIGVPALGLEDYEGAVVWSGLMNSKNTLGFWAAASVLLFVTLSWSESRPAQRAVCVLMALVALGVLIMAHSATSLLALVIAGGLCLFLFLAHRFRLGFVRMVAMGVVFIGLIAMVVVNIDTNDIVGRSEDLTGRAEVWRQVWQLILERPLTGYGYGAIWFPTDSTVHIQQRLTDFTWVVHHAHNGFLQTASEIGLPLTCLALLMIVQQLIEILYCQYERRQLGVLFVLGFVVAFLISNVSEARFLVHRQLYWIFFLALPISMLRQITLVGSGQGQIGAPHATPSEDDLWAPAGPAGAGWSAGSTTAASARFDQPGVEHEPTDIARSSTIHIQTDIDLGAPTSAETGEEPAGEVAHPPKALQGTVPADPYREPVMPAVSTAWQDDDAVAAEMGVELATQSDFAASTRAHAGMDRGDPDDTLDLTHDADMIAFWMGNRSQPASNGTGSGAKRAVTNAVGAELEVLDLPEAR